jgi:hypothetical protein
MLEAAVKVRAADEDSILAVEAFVMYAAMIAREI